MLGIGATDVPFGPTSGAVTNHAAPPVLVTRVLHGQSAVLRGNRQPISAPGWTRTTRLAYTGQGQCGPSAVGEPQPAFPYPCGVPCALLALFISALGAHGLPALLPPHIVLLLEHAAVGAADFLLPEETTVLVAIQHASTVGACPTVGAGGGTPPS